MVFVRRLVLAVMAAMFILGFILACEKDPVELGEGLISKKPFETGKAYYDVFAYNRKINAVMTNKLPLYQLGSYNDPVYGKTEAKIVTQVQLSSYRPTFGKINQSIEELTDSGTNRRDTLPENEEILNAYLYIPYLQSSVATDSDSDGVMDIYDSEPKNANNDEDGDGLSNIEEKRKGTDPFVKDTDGDGINDDKDDKHDLTNSYPRKRNLDSIYVNNKNADSNEKIFRLKVHASNYFLRDLDPEANFEEAQAYYSNQDFSAFKGEELYNDTVTIKNLEYVFLKTNDTLERNGTVVKSELKEKSVERMEPGIRVPLKKAFFQENILDREGASELLNSNNFKEFFRGLQLEIESENLGEDIMLMLNLSGAEIEIEYAYTYMHDKKKTKKDPNDDDELRLRGTFTINLITSGSNGAIIGNAVNTFENEPYENKGIPGLDTGDNANRIYLKGGAGAYGEIRLFENDTTSRTIINQIKTKKWIINEANLTFYVDKDAMTNIGEGMEPPRLYMFNGHKYFPLYKVATEYSKSKTSWGVYTNYDGNLKVSSDGRGEKYKVRITEYINDIIVRDSANAPLGLMISPDVRVTGIRDAMVVDDGEENDGDDLLRLPVAPSMSPLGTVLYGSNVDSTNANKLRLEIIYTEVD